MAAHKLIWITFSLCTAHVLTGQIIYQHTSDIVQLASDLTGNIYLVDDKGRSFVHTSGRIQAFNKIPSNPTLISEGSIPHLTSMGRLFRLSPKLGIAREFGNGQIDQFSYQDSCSLAYSGGIVQRLNKHYKPDKSIRVPFDHVRDMVVMGSKMYCTDQKALAIIDIDSGLDTIFNNEVLDLDIFREQYVFAAVKGKGIYRVMNNRMQRLYLNGVRIPDNILKIRSHDRGLFILDAEANLHYLSWDRQTLQLIDNQVSAFDWDMWHTLYYSSANALIRNGNFANQKLPTVSITEVERNYESVTDLQKIEVNSGEKVAIRYAGSYTPDPLALVYQYKINKGSWQDAGQDRLIIESWQEGRNDILIRASADGRYFSSPERLVVYRKDLESDAFWRVIFFVLSGLFLITLFSLLRRNRQDRAIEEERKKLKLELDLLQSTQKLGQYQMNPHFLFNCLNSIKGLIAIKDTTKARQAVDKFASMMRSLLDQSMDDRITLKNEIRFLEDYLSLEQMIRNNKFEYTIDNSEEDGLQIPPMIIQPFVENAILHGVSKIQEGGIIDLQFNAKGRYLYVTIADNGPGINTANNSEGSEHSGAAVSIVRKRLKATDRWTKEDPVIYSVRDSDNSKTGCVVRIRIPVIYR